MTVTTAKRNCSWSAGLPCNSTSEWARQEDLNGTFQLRNDYFEQLRREGAKKRATTKQNKAKRQLMVEVRIEKQTRKYLAQFVTSRAKARKGLRRIKGGRMNKNRHKKKQKEKTKTQQTARHDVQDGLRH